MSDDEFELYMREVFRPIDAAVARATGPVTTGSGYELHAVARKSAPAWLCKWNDDNRWVICLTNGWDFLVTMAKRFGHEKSDFIKQLREYRDKYGD